MPARLWLIRHAQTDWNAAGRIQGHTPTDLNAAGRAEAAALAEFFKAFRFAACYSSDLPRAFTTASIIAAPHRLAITTTPDLRERHFGRYEGMTGAEIREARAAMPDDTPPPSDLAAWTNVPGVESDDAVWARVMGYLMRLFAIHADGDVLVVSHGGVLHQAVTRVLGIPALSPRRYPLSNGMTAILTLKNATLTLGSLFDPGLLSTQRAANDTSSLPPAAD